MFGDNAKRLELTRLSDYAYDYREPKRTATQTGTHAGKATGAKLDRRTGGDTHAHHAVQEAVLLQTV